MSYNPFSRPAPAVVPDAHRQAPEPPQGTLISFGSPSTPKTTSASAVLPTTEALWNVFPDVNEEKTDALRKELAIPSDYKHTRAVVNNPTTISEFFTAITAHNVERISQLLLQGFDPNTTDANGAYSLHYAINADDMAITKLLLSQPLIAINLKDNNGTAPLHLLCRKIAKETRALGINARTGSSSSSGGNFLDTENIALSKSEQLGVMLLNHPGVDPNIKDKGGRTPLIISCSGCSLSFFRALLDKGASVTATTMGGVSALHEATHLSPCSHIDLLIKRGAPLGAKDNYGGTPMHHAAAANRIEVCELLKANGAVVRVWDSQNKLPQDVTTDERVNWFLTDMRTSRSHPLQVDFLYDGVLKKGRIGMSMCMGRNKKNHRRDLVADVQVLLNHGVQVLVTLVREQELESMGIPHFFEYIQSKGIETIHFPIKDKWLPKDMSDLHKNVMIALAKIDRDEIMVVHCNGGKGRTGLFIGAMLVHLGYDPTSAVAAVRAPREGMIRNPAQLLYLRSYYNTYCVQQ